MHFPGNISEPRRNPFAWTKLANVLYIDQPVGTGFSSGSFPPSSNLEVTEQFYQWLKEFYKEFPGLRSKNTFLTGESYAAIYVSTIQFLRRKIEFQMVLWRAHRFTKDLGASIC